MRRRRARRACAVALAGVIALWVIAWPALAASPSPAAGGVGDTRSSGQGAGFAGQPVLAAVAVVALGVATAGATMLYVRLTRAR